MNNIIKIKAGTPLFSIAVSVALHVLLFFIIAFIVDATSGQQMMRSVYVQLTTGMFTTDSKENETEETDELPDQPSSLPEEKPEQPDNEPGAAFYSLTETNTDTAGLKNIYTEKTLGVRIKYPAGWNFIDQNVKNKLDGVTFWGLTDIYNPPPYIHLEVKEKYLFNPSRYKYSQEFRDYTIYYNDPEEMADQYTQIIYVRTEDDEDYSLKLIMKGKESFKTFQPVFFGMLKTFAFGE